MRAIAESKGSEISRSAKREVRGAAVAPQPSIPDVAEPTDAATVALPLEQFNPIPEIPMNIMRRTSHRAAIGLFFALTLVWTTGSDWHAVRDLIRQGDQQGDEDAQAETYRKAYTIAQASVAARPKVSAEYLWLANAAGRLALVAPNAERVKLSKVVKENAEKAIALDPRNGPAHMTLGGWHFYVADLGWVQRNAAKALYGGLPPASFAKAVEHFGRALGIGGAENIVEIYYLRGRSYEELDMETFARADYQRCIATPACSLREKSMQEDARDRL